jgi:hypothetical protein
VHNILRLRFCARQIKSLSSWLLSTGWASHELAPFTKAITRSNGDRVRLFTRNGYSWTKRYPWIVESALKNGQKHFVIDGEAVILGVDGRSDFDALHSGKHKE